MYYKIITTVLDAEVFREGIYLRLEMTLLVIDTFMIAALHSFMDPSINPCLCEISPFYCKYCMIRNRGT
jgi:hypothetical protein